MSQGPSETQNYPPEKIELLKKRISGWLRQSRHRGRKIGIQVDASYSDVVAIYDEEQWKCAYCGVFPGSPDHPFPLKEKGLCVPSNILPCCDACRDKKQNHNLVRFYQDGHITELQLHELIKRMIHRKGGQLLREYLKAVYIGRGDIQQPQ